jgi:hypothetical protein
MPSAVHILIIIIIIIIIILFITFMQGVYNYTPATNHVSRVYSVAAVLYLQFVYMRICLTAHLVVSEEVLGFVAVWNIPSLVKFIIF